jgi:TM2 domain-containing membrane protein YozV
MNLAKKAALLNLILFPGWGQIYLKRYKKGIAIIIAVTAGALSILWSIVQTTIYILRIFPFKKGTVTFEAVVKLTINSIKATNTAYLLSILFFIIMLWIFSIIDAYSTGKKEMEIITIAADQQSTSPEN